MTITDVDIRKVFDGELLKLLPALGLSQEQVAWQNATFRPNIQQGYLRPALLPAESQQATLGYPCQIRLNGIYQIIICLPKDSGLAQGEKWAAVLLAAFSFGSVFNCCGNNLVVTRSFRSPATQAEDRLLIPVSVSYYSYTPQGHFIS